jgi:glycosyltransferase involved in cell wall biosynthesis
MENKKLIFITPFEYPTHMAHAIHGLSMARAFSENLGKENFLFFLNTVKDKSIMEGLNYYRMFGPFGWVIKKMRIRRFWIPISFIFLIIFNKKWNLKKLIIFINDPVLFKSFTIFKFFFGFKLILESHGFFDESQKKAMVKADRLIFVTKQLLNGYLNDYPEIRDKSFVLSNSFDPKIFDDKKINVNEFRKSIGIPSDKIVIGYIGRFMPLGYDKGLKLMVDSLENLSNEIICMFVGGKEEEIRYYKKYIESKKLKSRVVIIGHVEQKNIPKYMKICDILAYVPTDKNIFFEKETSPMKIFEYMTSKRPIIATDTPSIREVLDEDCAYLIKNITPESFANKVKFIMSNKEDLEKKTNKAYSIVSNNTWYNRAKRIISSF